ncbi:5-(carboxyamino)imidazole ribonucleotide mutase [Methanobacterium alcaliphilum]|uniref:5-(carboxyamino)imidazole ribonucleotide mutase n=1 Tax=Methanobacterium alcaliphilum TaxID=392018 RepID=UPI00200A7FF3|nr:5-(carboxyamino)imidazole ribonucleotide mutase [Methanobacterium alcaliphilum]MCK9151114.1 5-(carboxyamino)imidazole ribonucleotide mutase [Methanobacterium alcaliphilum]
MQPKVMILLGSASDYKIAEKAIEIFEQLEIAYDIRVASAHRTHEKVKQIVLESTKRGVKVFIGIAGLSAHLPGMIAANTHRPVVGVPVDVKIGGLDALFASSQMPFPAPVATVGIDRGENGALLAAQIIAIHDEEVRKKVSALRQGFYDKVQRDEYQLLNNIEGNFYAPEKIEFPKLDDDIFSSSSQESDDSPLIAVIPGSYSDMKIAKKTTMFLERMGISYDMNVISPIRYPDRFEKYMARMRDVKLFIAISGLSAHVTGAVVALSEKPVIGVPCPMRMGGMDALLSMVNMPPGVPVGTVGVANGGNAAVLAAEMLGISNKTIENRVKRLKSKSADIK